ncbi:MFS transporter [Paraburkholderia sediminicola]|uniref:MFS transporter n=1 Tax=Paraburkholderia sediminicola TaxID=458836 RepID=UPI0038B81624
MRHDSKQHPTLRGGWIAVSLLLLCYMFSYVDRLSLSVLVEPMKQTMHLSDTQIGLLQGFAFALCYAVAGLPLAWLVDRSSRVKVTAACVLVWGCATALCGAASSFGQLLVARAGTAVAEAGLPPAAVSLFGDFFPPRMLPRVSAIFVLAPYLGGGLALVITGSVLGFFSSSPWLSTVGLLPWQAVFVAIGAPGLLLSIMVLLVLKEPARREPTLFQSDGGTPDSAPDYTELPTMGETIRFLLTKSAFFPLYFTAFVFVVGMFYACATWFPTSLVRQFHLTPSVAGHLSGPVLMGAGIVGTLLSQLLVSGLSDDAVNLRVLTIMAGASILMLPVSLLLACANNVSQMLACYAVLIALSSIVTAALSVPLQLGVPNRMRGKAVSLFALVSSLLGGSGGPLSVGWLADHVFHQQTAVSASLSATCSLFAVIAAVLFIFARHAIVGNQSNPMCAKIRTNS